MGGRTGRGMARGNAPFLERGCSESAGGVSQKKSRREPYIVRDDLAGDEGFEPPQTESESGVLPLHKSPMPQKAFIIIRKNRHLSRTIFLFVHLLHLPQLPADPRQGHRGDPQEGRHVPVGHPVNHAGIAPQEPPIPLHGAILHHGHFVLPVLLQGHPEHLIVNTHEVEVVLKIGVEGIGRQGEHHAPLHDLNGDIAGGEQLRARQRRRPRLHAEAVGHLPPLGVEKKAPEESLHEKVELRGHLVRVDEMLPLFKHD